MNVAVMMDNLACHEMTYLQSKSKNPRLVVVRWQVEDTDRLVVRE